MFAACVYIQSNKRPAKNCPEHRSEPPPPPVVMRDFDEGAREGAYVQCAVMNRGSPSVISVALGRPLKYKEHVEGESLLPSSQKPIHCRVL